MKKNKMKSTKNTAKTVTKQIKALRKGTAVVGPQTTVTQVVEAKPKRKYTKRATTNGFARHMKKQMKQVKTEQAQTRKKIAKAAKIVQDRNSVQALNMELVKLSNFLVGVEFDNFPDMIAYVREQLKSLASYEKRTVKMIQRLHEVASAPIPS